MALEGIRAAAVHRGQAIPQEAEPDANAYYWQLPSRLAESAGISKNRAHNPCCGVRQMRQSMAMIYVVVPDDDSGEEKALEAETYHIKPTSEVKQARDGAAFRTYIMLRGSSTYDTREMSELINGLVSECREMGIETMTPDQLAEMMALYEQHRKKERP
ncbi:MAG: hypothetical protein ACLUOI_20720 [Eisenbergiella sp.]